MICPYCNHGVERIEGCNYLYCEPCQKAFCFQCGKKWPAGTIHTCKVQRLRCSNLIDLPQTPLPGFYRCVQDCQPEAHAFRVVDKELGRACCTSNRGRCVECTSCGLTGCMNCRRWRYGGRLIPKTQARELVHFKRSTIFSSAADFTVKKTYSNLVIYRKGKGDWD